MSTILPDYSHSDYARHDTVREIIRHCSEATRKWINDEISRDDLMDLCGTAGVCIAQGQHKGFEGHQGDSIMLRDEANVLLARLVELRGLLRYPRYAAARLEKQDQDTPKLREQLVFEVERTEPGFNLPEP
tara:strand:+ start:12149 stop:12541 length:393 start_codon:yes stop_codon:yes gene_type:complete